MPTALVISSVDPAGNPRPHRMIGWLAPHFAVTAISPRREPMEHAACLPLPATLRGGGLGHVPRIARLLLRRFERRLWPPEMLALAGRAAALAPAFIAVHDLELLPLALRIRELAGGGRVLFDAREYYPRHFEDRPLWRLLVGPFNRYLTRRYLGRADAVVTVSRGLAEAYRREYGVACGFLPSYPAYADLAPAPPRDGLVRLLHHGSVSRSRRLELTIEAMRRLPPAFVLDLVLVGPDAAYVARLRRLARPLGNRVRFLPPVPFAELITFSHGYDVGVFLVPPASFNLRFTLPNKFFEFIQARLAVAIGPSCEMAPIVQRYDCGIIADSFAPAALARSLAALTAADLMRLKTNSDRAARALNADALRPAVEAFALGRGGAGLFA